MTRRLSLAAVAALAVAACGGPGPRAIAWGQDECAHCHMTIADRRFAAQLVTRTGKTYVFDDIGCMARFLADGQVPVAEVHSYWMSDVSAPGDLRQVGMLRLLRSDSLRTPMASGLAAVAPERADSVMRALEGEPVAWEQVLAALGVAP